MNENGVKTKLQEGANAANSQRVCPPLGRGPSTYYNDECADSISFKGANARILNPKDISFHNNLNGNNPNSMSPSKKLNSIGNANSITGTAQKDG